MSVFMKPIKLTQEQQDKIVDAQAYHDAYFVDVLLKTGEIKYSLASKERMAIMPTSTCDSKNYNFEGEDIKDIRPALGLIKKLFDPWRI